MKKLFLSLFLLAGMSFGQVTVAPITNPRVQFFNNSVPCAGCLLDTFSSGTTTPLATYSESTGTTPNANPVVLGSDGSAVVYLTSASYKFRLRTAAGATLWTQDVVSWASPLSTFSGITSTGNVVVQPSTAATSGANQSSPTLCIDGFYFNVTSLTDQWCLSDVLGTGTNPTSVWTLTHSGSSGPSTLNFSNVAITAKRIDTLSVCDNSAFANTAACQTDASTTGGMFFPPNYSIGAFTNANNRPVLDFTKVDWRGTVSIKDFGAVGDGSTDDTTAIQAAIWWTCTGASTTAPIAGVCSTLGGTVLIPTPSSCFKTTKPLLTYGSITLQGEGILTSKICKTTNTVGTFGSITAGSGVGRTPTSCSGGPCVDNYNVDAILEVVYQSSGSTAYAGFWNIRDLALFGQGTNGTAFGIYAPRAMRFEIANTYVFMNCTNGNAAVCGAVSGSGFYTRDSHTYTIRKSIVDSSAFSFKHDNDGSGSSTGTSAVYENNYAVFVGLQGYGFFGLNYSILLGNACDHFNLAAADVNNTNNTYACYGFSTSSGIVMLGGGAEDLKGTVVALDTSSVAIEGGFKTFAQAGFTSAASAPGTLYVSNSQLTLAGTIFSATSPAGNFFNTIIQSGSTVIDDNAVMPSGANAFIGYSGGSIKMDRTVSGMTLTSASGVFQITPTGTVFTEGTLPAGVNGADVCGADSTSHSLQCSYNNDAFRRVLRESTAASGNTIRLTADLALAANTNLQTIFSWTIPAAALNYDFHCSVLYSQATAAVADTFGIQAATNAPTNIQASGIAYTSTTVSTAGNIPTLATTTATAFVTFTPSATATNFVAILEGQLENPASANVLNIMASQSNAADILTIKRGSYCTLYQR